MRTNDSFYALLYIHPSFGTEAGQNSHSHKYFTLPGYLKVIVRLRETDCKSNKLEPCISASSFFLVSPKELDRAKTRQRDTLARRLNRRRPRWEKMSGDLFSVTLPGSELRAADAIGATFATPRFGGINGTDMSAAPIGLADSSVRFFPHELFTLDPKVNGSALDSRQLRRSNGDRDGQAVTVPRLPLLKNGRIKNEFALWLNLNYNGYGKSCRTAPG